MLMHEKLLALEMLLSGFSVLNVVDFGNFSVIVSVIGSQECYQFHVGNKHVGSGGVTSTWEINSQLHHFEMFSLRMHAVY